MSPDLCKDLDLNFYLRNDSSSCTFPFSLKNEEVLEDRKFIASEKEFIPTNS